MYTLNVIFKNVMMQLFTLGKIKVAVLLSYFIGLSLLTCAQEITVSETYKVRRKSAVIYSQYATSARLVFPSDSISEVKLRTGAGKLEVKPSENNTIELEATIENRSLGKKKARKFIEKYMRLSMENVNGTLEVISYFEGTKRKFNNRRYGLGHMIETPGSKINVVLKVPQDIYIGLNDHSGAISIHDLKNDVKLRDRSGGINIKNVQGNLEIHDGSGGLSIFNHEGNLTINDGSGRIYLDGIGMKEQDYTIKIKDASGGISGQGLGGDVSMIDTSGNLRLKNISGNVNVNDRSGNTYIAGVGGHLKIKDTSGGIYLKDIATHKDVAEIVTIRDTSGKIELRSIGTSASIIDRSGGISVRSVNGNLNIIDRSGGISASDIAGTVQVKDRSGRVTAGTYLVKN